MSRFVAVFGLVMSLTASASVSAQALNIERFRPTLDRFGFLGMQGSATPGHARWNLGLGGEVDNPAWKAQWPGVSLFNSGGDPAVRLVKSRSAQGSQPAPT